MDRWIHRNDSLLWKKISQTNSQNIFHFHPPFFSDLRLIEGNVAFKPASYVTMVEMFVPSNIFYISVIKIILSKEQSYFVWKYMWCYAPF